MSYPPGPPGSPGYPPAQQATNQFAAPTQQFGKPVDPSVPGGPSKLPVYLAAAAAVLGLAVYLSSFAPLFTISATDFPGLGSVSGSSFGLVLAVAAAVLAGLFAGASMLPKQAVSAAAVAVLAVLAFLLVIAEVINRPTGASIDWGLYLIIAFTLFQAIVAVAALLLESGVITAPTPRPKYDQHQYGQYGGPGQYYGQPQGQPHHPQQRQGYPSTYPGGYPGGPSTGGYPTGPQSGQSGQQAGQSGQSSVQSGPPTPPTGFPAYGQPPSGSSSASQAPQQPSSSSQSGSTPS